MSKNTTEVLVRKIGGSLAREAEKSLKVIRELAAPVLAQQRLMEQMEALFAPFSNIAVDLEEFSRASIFDVGLTRMRMPVLPHCSTCSCGMAEQPSTPPPDDEGLNTGMYL